MPAFVKKFTSEGFFLPHLHGERLGWVGIGNRGLRVGEGRPMGHQLKQCRSANAQNAWLSMLVDAMEKVARPECRAVPCDRLVLAAVRAQLARPASSYAQYGSHFSLQD